MSALKARLGQVSSAVGRPPGARHGVRSQVRLEGCNDLRPDRNHPQKQRKRGKCSGFDGNSSDHDQILPDENKTRT
jgi:hypothetical protein